MPYTIYNLRMGRISRGRACRGIACEQRRGASWPKMMNRMMNMSLVAPVAGHGAGPSAIVGPSWPPTKRKTSRIVDGGPLSPSIAAGTARRRQPFQNSCVETSGTEDRRRPSTAESGTTRPSTDNQMAVASRQAEREGSSAAWPQVQQRTEQTRTVSRQTLSH